jgi:glyoxylase-like metal-dependent hydrolase (beta-lactamase superfamily II)
MKLRQEISMPKLSRRNVVLSAAAAAATFGLDKPLEIIGSASAQQGGGATALNPKGLKFHRFKVGDIEVTQVFDGAVERDHNPGFVKNASLDDQKAALKAAGIADAKMPNCYTVTVVKLGNRHIMFDAGNGANGRPNTGLLDDGLKEAGIDPAKIGTVVITHFHPDHISGLIAKDGTQVFGHAEIVVPALEWKYWTDPVTASTAPENRKALVTRIQATLPNWKNIRQANADTDVVAGIKSVATYGHSPGHTSYLMSSGDAQLIVLGDVNSIPPLNLRNPGWHLSFDQDAKMAEETRRKTFDRVIADKMVATGYHWGMPGAGMLAKDGNGYALVPVKA